MAQPYPNLDKHPKSDLALRTGNAMSVNVIGTLFMCVVALLDRTVSTSVE